MKRFFKWSAGVLLVFWIGLWGGLRITERVTQDHTWRLYSDRLIFQHPRVMIPHGALLDPRGDLIIATADRLWRRHSDGRLESYAGHEYDDLFWRRYTPMAPKDGAGDEARFESAALLAVDHSGNAYIQDMDLSRGTEASESLIRKVDPQGRVTTVARIPNLPPDRRSAPALYLVQGADVDSDGNLYLAESEPAIVWKMDPAGHFQQLIGQESRNGYRDGPAVQAQFHWLTGLALGPKGDVFLSDFKNRVIRRLDRDGQVDTFAGMPGEKAQRDGGRGEVRFASPEALAFDPSGRLFVFESRPDALRMIEPDGGVRTLPTQWKTLGANLHFRSQLSIDVNGNLVLFRPGYPIRLERISSDGKVEKLLDTGKGIAALY